MEFRSLKPGSGSAMEIRVAESFGDIDARQWNSLVEPGNPFMLHEFFAALENTRCIGKGTAWEPRIFLGFTGEALVAAVPAFRRSDSYGEYIFDWAWANAYAQAGIAYYPKLTVAAPFTPATGRRILSKAPLMRESVASFAAALEADALQNGISGIHILCETRAEQRMLSELHFSPRLTHQYHWLNRKFQAFEDFLQQLRAHRRKEIKRERKKCAELGLDIRIVTGNEITEEQMLAMYGFYLQTYSRKWGSPYLNRETFLALRRTMSEYVVLVLAYDGARPVAGSIAFRAADRLYGRYWGADGYYPFLHFELCLYRLIDFAIAEKISVFEAGAQGEHKFARGFTAMPVFSSHRLLHPQGAQAIDDFLRRERRMTARALAAYRRASPNKNEPEYLPEAEDNI